MLYQLLAKTRTRTKHVVVYAQTSAEAVDLAYDKLGEGWVVIG